jgi:SsrA-binding protein
MKTYNRVNKKLNHKYKVLETFVAGLVLKGWQVKSITKNLYSFENSFIYIKDNEVFCKNLELKPAKESSNVTQFGYDTSGDIKLLLTKREILKLQAAAGERGMTLIPGSLFHNGKRYKLNLCVCKGKNERDKRTDIIERETKIEVQRAQKRSKINLKDFD